MVTDRHSESVLGLLAPTLLSDLAANTIYKECHITARVPFRSSSLPL